MAQHRNDLEITPELHVRPITNLETGVTLAVGVALYGPVFLEHDLHPQRMVNGTGDMESHPACGVLVREGQR